MTARIATVKRETAETAVEVELDVDGRGNGTADTGVGFYDHMLESFAKHGLFDLRVRCEGDTEIDDHHTVEDVAITLGTAFDDALGDRVGVRRYANRTVPMDEAKAEAVLDLSGRPFFRFDGKFSQERVGEFTSDMARHAARSLATHLNATLHVAVDGQNAHHEVEALFKALAYALDDATRIDDRREAPPSTKGEV
jgi:imidazoleglycerol-phosphate dehydratase